MKYKQKKLNKLAVRHSYLKSMASKSTLRKKEEGKTIIGSNGEFEESSIKLNRGFGEQLALPISMWSVLDPNQLALSLS